MKEAVGNAGLTNFVIIFIIILLLFFIGSLSYSKAAKVKNRIIAEIEKDQAYDSETQKSIDEWLAKIGYRINYRPADNGCPPASRELEGAGASDVTKSNKYRYCVYEVDTCRNNSGDSVCGKYYRVIAYMYFDFPVIGQLIQVPVRGDTKTFTTVSS